MGIATLNPSYGLMPLARRVRYPEGGNAPDTRKPSGALPFG